jgi:hypothetical protein
MVGREKVLWGKGGSHGLEARATVVEDPYSSPKNLLKQSWNNYLVQEID